MIEIVDMNLEDFEKIKENLLTEFDDFWTPGILESEIKSENSKYVVAKENDNIVGFAGIIILPDDIEITNIVTKKSERKKGIGKLLLDKLIEMSKTYDKDIISLEVNENNIAAINLYKKFNFEQIGLRKKYYNGKDNALIMNRKI
jgi:ribosomal-protein-alanine N-acetyltransferase